MDPTMEKPEHMNVEDEKNEKNWDNAAKTSGRRLDLGEVVNIDSTPKEERKVLLKLDLL
jgi:hypothetical protein